jgi:hypothetical protein
MDNLLGQLTHRQLVTLVKAAINEGADHLIPVITKYVWFFFFFKYIYQNLSNADLQYGLLILLVGS